MVATHTIQYTNATTTISGQTIRITFDPTTDAFGGIQSLVTSSVTFSGASLVGTCTGAASEVTLTTSTAANDESVIFTVCAGDTVSAGAKTITINGTITNPVGAGSYIVRIAGTQDNSADTRVAIISSVTVTASVDTSFTFTIAAVATGTDVNGTTTTANSTATAINFGTLVPGQAKFIAQELSVTTNAKNGFIVTVKENQNLLSSTGADIDLFKDGSSIAAPTAWTSPLGTLDQENTYGHIGLTSEDSDLNGDEFAAGLYAGNFQATSSRQVFSHTGPADGTTADKGLTQVGYRIQVTALQEAANDYTNTLTYVATPTF